MARQRLRMRVAIAALTACWLSLGAFTYAQECPPEGAGGDPDLNQLKNRTEEPASYRELTVEQFIKDFPPDLQTPKFMDRFSDEQWDYITKRDDEGIALIGYLLAAKQSGPEATNCYSETRRDFHVWIGAVKPSSPKEAKALRAESVVVEPTPDGQETHSNWRLHTLQKLAKQGAKVRISGWAMYDPEHPDQLGKTRGTLWEVHPVTKIEVLSGGDWREL